MKIYTVTFEVPDDYQPTYDCRAFFMDGDGEVYAVDKPLEDKE